LEASRTVSVVISGRAEGKNPESGTDGVSVLKMDSGFALTRAPE
jgi:hypothetical protein